jgi:hypothetical protein
MRATGGNGAAGRALGRDKQMENDMTDTTSAHAINTDLALTDPAKVFGTPDEVLACDSITKEQKRKILRRWEMDARLMAVAEEEGMTGGESNQLDLVGKALLELGEDKPHHADQGAGNKLGS